MRLGARIPVLISVRLYVLLDVLIYVLRWWILSCCRPSRIAVLRSLFLFVLLYLISELLRDLPFVVVCVVRLLFIIALSI